MKSVRKRILMGLLLVVPIGAQLPSMAQDKQSTTSEKSTAPPATKSEPKSLDSGGSHGPIDILSDTGGMDVRPYLSRVLMLLKTSWYSQVPDSARPPIMKKGKVIIMFHILKDGTITDVNIKTSSGDTALDGAAYAGIISSNPLPSIGKDFGCRFLALQIHFYYNEPPDTPSPPNQSVIPCVTSKIRVNGEIGLEISPSSVQVVLGGKQQFLAAIHGESSSGVNWTLTGSGCSGATCGSISAEGLYTAPATVLIPPLVTVTATLASAPSQTATSAVTIVSPPK